MSPERKGVRVVAFGGGTGLPVLLRGLRQTGTERVCAVVTVADDGGSSGRLREELGVAPPGDIRNCLVALAERRGLAEVFNYRFERGVELRDHSVGNIIIAALMDMSGGLCEGVAQAGRFLRIRGTVLPATTASVTLVVRHADGSITRGQSTVRHTGRAVRGVAIEPANALAPAAVIEAINASEIAVLSSGSLFTSTIPALLGDGVRDALARFGGPIIYVANIMTQPGETDGFALSDHVRALTEHAGPVLTDVLVNACPLPAPLISRYRDEGGAPVQIDRGPTELLGVAVHEARLLDERAQTVRHDPRRLAEAVYSVATARLKRAAG